MTRHADPTREDLLRDNRKLRMKLEDSLHSRRILESITDQQRSIQQRLIDELGRAVEEIEQKNRLLEDWARTLEHRVEERTAELSQALEDLRALRHVEQGMLHAQKLESLGVLAGGIAHDFNNLLSAILGNAELACLRLDEGQSTRANLQEISRTARRAADLCRQMLAYAGRTSMCLEHLDLNEVVQEMADMLAVSVSKKARVERALAGQRLPLTGDPGQVRQIVLNLVLNASEALGDRPGTIVLATGSVWCDRTRLDASYLGAGRPEGEYLFLEVSDTGCGIEPQTLARIFDPFFTTKTAGRGLGLAAVAGVARGHGGAIEVSSTPGEGTTFRVLFPVAATEPAAVVAEPVPVAGRGSGLVLLVDDEEDIRRLGEAMLGRAGFDVVCAADGVEGLEVFRARQAEIRAVVLDLTMPRMGGEEVLREIRRQDPSIPILVTSGYGEQSIAEQCGDAQPTALLQKPFDWSDLVTRILTMSPATGRDGQPAPRPTAG